MCGRYASSREDADFAHYFDATAWDEPPAPSWNIAPTDPGRIVIERDGDRQLRTMRWGLVPIWSTDRSSAARMINARAETVTQKPAFRDAAARRRCLVPADGYYEWMPTARGKVPQFLHADGILAFAGLFERWRIPDLPDDDPDRWLVTYTIVTRPASDALGHIHDRSPVVVPPEMYDEWLDADNTELTAVRDLLAAMPLPHLDVREVSNAVNSVRNNGPHLIEVAVSSDS